jgi:acetylornithine deacetylase/succinyl-diaminopimelate desuccinylase-like protein
MMLDVVETARQLVRIPSVNPMGQSVSGAEYYEHALTDFLADIFRQLNVPFERQTVEPQRDNIVARLDGATPPEAGGQLLVLEVHQDTVPVEGMTVPPWEAVIDGDKLYGRGACDVKGGMAAMLAAFSRLATERPPGMPTVVLACSVNEECGFTGARKLAESWAQGSSRLVPRLPDAVIVAEPTSEDVVVAHKGVVRWRCEALGRAAHSSRPENGDNAIYRMAEVVMALKQYAQQLGDTEPHPRLGHATLSVGTVRGGVSANVVPDRCRIDIDRRLLPHETPAMARQAVMDWLEAQRAVAATSGVREPAGTNGLVRHEAPFMASPGLDDAANQLLAGKLRDLVVRQGGSGRLVAVPYGTDAPAFASHGIPTVIFGPGSIEQAHTADEWVSAGQLQFASEIYYQLAARGV